MVYNIRNIYNCIRYVNCPLFIRYFFKIFLINLLLSKSINLRLLLATVDILTLVSCVDIAICVTRI